MEISTARKLAIELIEASPAVYVTTITEDGYPQTRAMLNLRNPVQHPSLTGIFQQPGQEFLFYYTTNTSSQKINQMNDNSKIAAYYCTPDSWRGVCFTGDFMLVEDQSIKAAIWQPDWKLYYPKGSTDPDYTIFQLVPRVVKGYHQLQSYQFEL